MTKLYINTEGKKGKINKELYGHFSEHLGRCSDYEWTEKLMQAAGKFMDGLSLHYYTIPTGGWEKKGSATDFDEDTYYITLKKAFFMEELIRKHGAIMDKYDPEKGWALSSTSGEPGTMWSRERTRDSCTSKIP